MLLVALAYVPALGAGWVWDDDDYVTENRTLRSLHGLGSIWFEIGAVPQYYPLVHTSFWIEHRLWGLDPAGYHAVNVLLHAVAAILAWRVLRRLDVPGAWVAAAIFALHPVQVESVAWVTERKNVLSAVCYLGALLAYLRFERSRGARAYAGALTLFVAALLSKTVTASLPAAILVVAWWKRGRLTRRDIEPTLPLFALGAAAGLLTVWMEKHHVGAAGAGWDLSLLDRTLIASRASLFYLGKLVWPDPLSFVYARWDVHATPWVWWGSLAIVAGALLALFRLRSRIGRGPLAASLLFGGTLFPALGFFDLYPMRFSFVADHFQYLACLAPIAALVAVVATPPSAWRRGASAAVLVILSALTWNQCKVYKDEETLFRDAAEKIPRAFLAQNNLGGILLERGEVEEARRRFEAALAAAPDFPEALVNMGLVAEHEGKLGEAEARYRRALAIDPAFADAHNNLGIVLARSGNMEGAIAAFRKAVAHRKEFPRASYNLGVALLAVGRRAEGVEALERAVSLSPEEPAFRSALEWARNPGQPDVDSSTQDR